MYTERANLIIGFHGCDESVRDNVINGRATLSKSENRYDWLGNGIYFWEYNFKRALQFAKEKKQRGEIDKPSVLGAIICLNHCLDLIDSDSINIVKTMHDVLKESMEINGLQLPANKNKNGDRDFIFRELDCFVIEGVHKHRKEKKFSPFDSVRGVFWEGKEIYDNAGFKEKNHIQLCIREPEKCIKGYFKPLIK